MLCAAAGSPSSCPLIYSFHFPCPRQACFKPGVILFSAGNSKGEMQDHRGRNRESSSLRLFIPGLSLPIVSAPLRLSLAGCLYCKYLPMYIKIIAVGIGSIGNWLLFKYKLQ